VYTTRAASRRTSLHQVDASMAASSVKAAGNILWPILALLAWSVASSLMILGAIPGINMEAYRCWTLRNRVAHPMRTFILMLSAFHPNLPDMQVTRLPWSTKGFTSR
jgi:hypothetical protein